MTANASSSARVVPHLPNANPDTLQNYDIQGEIGKGRSSVVYIAICKRGRLRNRKMALKKMLSAERRSDSSRRQSEESALLHQSLHHPCIVSLFSVFSIPSVTYHVLELCSQGPLSDYIAHHTSSKRVSSLSHVQLRGVVKSLADALLYLRKELVLHRNVTPSNIFVADESRIKLGDFSLAARLPAADATCSTLCGSPNYASPEMISRVHYSFPSDVWSLGCVMLMCLTGRQPFEANSVTEIYERVSRGRYELPPAISLHARHLISELLKLNPQKRIRIEDILLHPFFDASLSTDSLGPQILKKDQDRLRNILELETGADQNLQRFPILPKLREGSEERYGVLSKDSPIASRPLANMMNTVHISCRPSSTRGLDVRRILSEEIKLNIRDKPRFPQVQTGRRVFSAPQPRAATSVNSLVAACVKSRPRANSSVSPPGLTEDAYSERSDASDPVDDQAVGDHHGDDMGGVRWKKLPLLRRPLKDKLNEPTRHVNRRVSVPWLSDSVDPPLAPVAKTELNIVLDSPPDLLHVLNNQLEPQSQAILPQVDAPVDPTRPAICTTGNLQPQIHKLSCGQLSVLAQTRSVLVDFRERERRKGRRGDKVLVIDADGQTIKIYNAPHLSTPCCLVEPVAVYTLATLPPEYRKQYNDAGHVLQQIKQRTPKLTMELSEARCRLMSNEPRGDIELLFHDPEKSQDRQLASLKNHEMQRPYMRLRLARNNQTLEIARHVTYSSQTSPATEEWTKKLLPVCDTGLSHQLLAEKDEASLDNTERSGLDSLRRFLQVCRAVEDLEANTGMSPATGVTFHSTQPYSRPKFRGIESARQSQDDHSDLESSASQSNKPSRSLGTECSAKSVAEGNTPPFETRFIPSVGWCMRYGSKGGSQRRYRLMFLDGTIMEIDFIEQTMKLTDHDGKITDLHLQRKSQDRAVEDRMKSFHQFMAMFSSD